ncbi:MAG: hypothetical protein ACRC1M_05780 [Methanobacteriaceae archaeon]
MKKPNIRIKDYFDKLFYRAVNGEGVDLDVVQTTLDNWNDQILKNSYERITKNPYVSQEWLEKNNLLTGKEALRDLYTNKQLEVLNNNLNYANEVIGKARVDIDQFNKLANTRLGPDVNEAFKASVKSGWSMDSTQLSYKQIENLNSQLVHYGNQLATLEDAQAMNAIAEEQGLDLIYPTKTWQWSELKNTRHMQMDGQTVGINDEFTVTNGKTGDVDMLQFPGDINNGSPGNTYNCKCNLRCNKR